MRTVQIKDDDIEKIVELDKKYKEFTIKFGMLHIDILALEEKLKTLRTAENELKQEYITLQTEELKLSEYIKSNYGHGELNLDTKILTVQE